MNLLLSFLFWPHMGLFAQTSTEFENEMYDVYKSSYQKEIGDQEWSAYVSKLPQRSYVVAEGDTLWDLSTIFFGDGHYWSKIWSYNSRLTNPHLLRVGMSVSFFGGSMDEAPGIYIDSQGQEINNTQADTFQWDRQKKKWKASNAVREKLYPGAPSLPAPRKRVRQVLSKIPSSFEDYYSFDASQYNEKGISFDLRPPILVNPSYVAHSFLYEGKARDYPKVGTLIESEDNRNLVGLSQKVYIRSSETLEENERFTIMGRDYVLERNGVDGDVIRFMGTVEINETLGKGIYRGTIIRSLSGVRGVPWISREPIPSMEDDFSGRHSSVKLQIVGGGEDNSSRIFGQGDVVFLNGGANAGLRSGDILGVYKRRDIRYSDVKVDRAPLPIAHIKVFRAEPHLASAFVLNSEEVVVPGDETGSPSVVESPVAQQDSFEDLEVLEAELDPVSTLEDPEIEEDLEALETSESEIQ